jgi:hypothetical protein
MGITIFKVSAKEWSPGKDFVPIVPRTYPKIGARLKLAA